MIDKLTIDRIFETAQIVDIVQDYVTLKKRGVNYIACCPFHDEKTPSFSVSPAKNIFKCFGCGKAGNAVTFVKEHENVSYTEALKLVAKKYGIEVKERELTEQELQQNNDRESMMALNAFAQTYFSKTLHDHIDGKNIGLPYFVERGISAVAIQKFQLGYALEQRNAFAQAALGAGFKKEFLVKTGLCIERQGGEVFDRFAGRVMFPVHSLSGNIIAFGGRTLKTDKSVAKYLNSPESELYHKGSVLYGLFLAKKSMVQHNKCFLVEGYTDVISMHQSGIENVVAGSGTALSIEQIRLIRRFTPNVTVLYDGDAAGIKASLRGIDMLLQEGMNIKTLLLPEGEDPDSFARAHSASEFNAYIEQKEEDFIKFKTKILFRDAGNDPVRKAEFINDIVRSIAVIPDGITRTVYVNECSKLMQIDEGVLTQEVAKLRRKQWFDQKEKSNSDAVLPPPPAATPATATLPAFVENVFCREQEKELIYYLLKFGHLPFFDRHVSDYIIQEMLNEELQLQNLEYQQVFEEYRKLRDEQGEVNPNYFLHHSDPKVCELAVNLLSSKYTTSRIWQTRGAQPLTEEERLHVDLPKMITAYKSKIITQSILGIAQKIATATAEESTALMEQVEKLNQVRTKLAKSLDRVLL